LIAAMTAAASEKLEDSPFGETAGKPRKNPRGYPAEFLSVPSKERTDAFPESQERIRIGADADLPRRLMMWPMTACLGISAVHADAVFVSELQRRDEPSAGQVRHAVGAAIRAFGYSGCAGRVAQEFGEHPETAVIRMRWARGVAREAFADAPSRSAAGGQVAVSGALA
jgi:hypothetical protein